jgi:hypothetical protein
MLARVSHHATTPAATRVTKVRHERLSRRTPTS